MRWHNTMRESSVQERAAGGMTSSSCVVLIIASLFVASVGFVQAAVAGRAEYAPPELAGRQFSAAAPAERPIQLASQLPRISTPQLHVNTGMHVNTTNVHPAIGVNSNAVKIKAANSQSLKTTSAHQFDKNNGGKGKGGNTKGASGGYFLKLDGIEGESMDTSKGRGPDIP
jgi:hypothetical protein